MPSHSIPSALIKLFHLDGAPWNWPAWQELTGIKHGIFPPDDSCLPKGLSRQDVVEIQSYFNQYQALPTEDQKIKFTSQRKGSMVSGRIKWRNWITAGWKSWKIHAMIEEALTSEGIHPVSIMITNDDLQAWPAGDMYIPIALDAVGLSLFGQPAMDPSGRLATRYRQATQHLVQRSWITIHKQSNRNKSRLVALEEAATKAFHGQGYASHFLLILTRAHM
jgi:hypothetical protein